MGAGPNYNEENINDCRIRIYKGRKTILASVS